MVLQDLYRVISNDTWVTIDTGSTAFSPKYICLSSDIPLSLLDRHIKALSAIDLNHLLISIA
nr:MAG TPA: RK-1 DEFENSIN defensin, triple-stranded beta-sheet, ANTIMICROBIAL [Caudoviricetes sp.]